MALLADQALWPPQALQVRHARLLAREELTELHTVTLFFSAVLSDLPQPVLAAIVLAAVTGLVHVSALRRLWRFSRTEFAVAALAFLGVLGSGILTWPQRSRRNGASPSN